MPIHHSCFKNPFEEKHQDVKWENSFPYSNEYQDRFFQDDAVAEIKNIFIEPNQLLEKINSNSQIHIGELGFGFGLNFFVTAKFWHENNKSSNPLNLEYISIDEALPSKEQLLKIINAFPELKEICNIFLERYELAHNDIQRIYFPSLKIRLTLIHNDIESGLKNLLGFKNNQINAWYLDGFDPNKNKSMWSNSVFQYIKFLSARSATFGTFTSAGFVRRRLKKFGFEVDKVKGFGKKRHKLIGRNLLGISAPNISFNKNKKIAIIGSGIAACSAAYAATQNGAQVEIFESADNIAAGASGNPVAAMYPRFSANNSPYSFLTAQSYFFAEKIYAQLPNAYKSTGLLFSHSNDYQKEWIEDMKSLNRADLFQIIDTKEMKKLYGLESHGLIVKKGGYLFPKLICKEMTAHQNIKISCNHYFDGWNKNKSKIDIHFLNQEKKSGFDDLIIANGPGLTKYLSGLKISKGQLVGLRDEQPINLDLPINSAGYILPRKNNITWIGSTHEKEFNDIAICLKTGHELIERTNNNFNINLTGLDNMLMEANLRVGSKDRLPLAGKIEENIYTIGALGSRGFSLGPLLGDYVASLINNSPSPISSGVALAIEPLRFKD
jgi:tRNA 5-methylaminomethyl-2-thiouridine biosynthesis bifunctional protein